MLGNFDWPNKETLNCTIFSAGAVLSFQRSFATESIKECILFDTIQLREIRVCTTVVQYKDYMNAISKRMKQTSVTTEISIVGSHLNRIRQA